MKLFHSCANSVQNYYFITPLECDDDRRAVNVLLRDFREQRSPRKIVRQNDNITENRTGDSKHHCH